MDGGPRLDNNTYHLSVGQHTATCSAVGNVHPDSTPLDIYLVAKPEETGVVTSVGDRYSATMTSQGKLLYRTSQNYSVQVGMNTTGLVCGESYSYGGAIHVNITPFTSRRLSRRDVMAKRQANNATLPARPKPVTNAPTTPKPTTKMAATPKPTTKMPAKVTDKAKSKEPEKIEEDHDHEHGDHGHGDSETLDHGELLSNDSMEGNNTMLNGTTEAPGGGSGGMAVMVGGGGGGAVGAILLGGLAFWCYRRATKADPKAKAPKAGGAAAPTPDAPSAADAAPAAPPPATTTTDKEASETETGDDESAVSEGAESEDPSEATSETAGV